ncbi:MAG: UvrD-helicase domain-containing protein, partial [Tsuneonella sp.]
GAAEMAERVNAVLARWVRLEETRLAKELIDIGAPNDRSTIDRARTLFASVLDCPGGGLRIDTIHAFSQWLLAAFPDEAGLIPGTRPMEDRDRDVLAHKVLAGMVAEAEASGDEGVLAPLSMLSERMGPADVPQWLMRCAEAREMWFGPGSWQPPMRDRVLGLLGLSADAGEDGLAELCSDGVFDCTALDRLRAANAAWGTATALKSLDAIADFLGASGMGRVSAAGPLEAALFTQAGAVRSLSSLEKHDPDYAIHAETVEASFATLRERRALLALAGLLVPALDLGRRFALAWEEAKTREGLIDFDDQIRRAAALLSNADVAPWIRYKLDRRFDHVLVDEAQDTNRAQWDIVRAITDDFYSGEGQREGVQRTLFVVGDYKQAIFGFQGTSPENFATARRYYAELIDALAATDPAVEALLPLGLGRSYRTSQPVLDFVDAAIATIGQESFGIAADETVEQHIGYDRPGIVTMWRPVSARGGDDEDGPEDWLSEPERAMANRIADQVAGWLRHGFPLAKDGGRNAGPGDIMVLVRKRRELAGLIVARLHAAGVPVAGVDRLRLGAPLGVKDLMAALRFAAQPLDDLSLANLLVSPLVGWTQEDLLEHGWRAKGRLWDHIRKGTAPLQMATAEKLRDLLRIA